MSQAPDFHTINCTGPREYEVRRNSDGKRIGVYPTAELGWKVLKDCDRKAVREWIKAQKKAVMA